MGLPAPEVADGIDTEGGIEHEEGAPHARQQKTAKAAHPAVIEIAHYEG